MSERLSTAMWTATAMLATWMGLELLDWLLRVTLHVSFVAGRAV